MKQILFATGNQTKSKRFSEGLLKNGIEVLSLKDIQLNLDVEETGKDAIENAIIKARACYNEIKMSVIGMDDTLYLENVPNDMQPGLYVRRVNGKTLDDYEMLEHYTNLVKEYGIDGKLNSKWIYGLAVINEKGEEFFYSWIKDNFYMVETLSEKMNSGYPLNTISKYKVLDKYFTDITDEDKEFVKINEEDVIEFITQHV